MNYLRQWMRLVETTPPAEVSNSGAPGLWYHGTPYAFDEFDVNAGEFDSNHETPAIFLTNDPDLAEAYASRERQSISDGLPWGEMKKEFIEPTEAILTRSEHPAADYLASSAESVLNGQYDFAQVLAAVPDVAADLRRMKARFDARLVATRTTMGANIRPVAVTGRFMHVRMLTEFNASYYDFFMREAMQARLAGVLFHNVVDSPSGGGPAADILAVFDPRNIRPKFGFIRDLSRGSNSKDPTE